MNASRQLALRLHALHKDDRTWLLEQIDGEARRELEGLLGELTEIGLSADEGLLRSLSSNANEAAPQVAGSEAALHIDAAAVGTIYHALRNEPAALRRCIVQMRHWHWLNDLDAETQVFFRGGYDVQRQEPSAGLAPAARESLLRALVAQLPESAAPLPGALGKPKHPRIGALLPLRRGLEKALKWRA